MGLFSKKKTEDNTQEKAHKEVKKSDAKKVGMSVSNAGYNIIISPIVSEKSHGMSQNGKYLFKVAVSAGKRDVKRAIEDIYKVNVDKVNVLIVSSKKRTIKYNRGYQKAYKKAIVTLKKGQSITVFEGM